MNRERTYRTEAIVLRRRNWGEADRLLTLLTPRHGKIRARAAGIRKPASRKAGHLELFCRSAVFLAKGRDLDIVTQAETIDSHAALRDDLTRSASASYAAEMADRFSPDGAENPAAYALLSAALDALCGPMNSALLLRHYDLRLLEAMGYRPELFHCVSCRAEIRAEDQYFSAALGGAVCPRCESKTETRYPVPLPALRLLRHLQRTDLADLSALAVQPVTLTDAERVLQRYIQYLLEQPIRSRDFLRKVGG